MTVEVPLLLTILGSAGTTALTLWAHGREIKQDRQKTLEAYAEAQVRANGHERDIAHARRATEQQSHNMKVLDDQYDERFRSIEQRLGELAGAFQVVQMIVDRRRHDD